MSLYLVAGILGALAVLCFALAAWADYRKWDDPQGAPSEFGKLTREQLSRIERNQRHMAAMDRGAFGRGVLRS